MSARNSINIVVRRRASRPWHAPRLGTGITTGDPPARPTGPDAIWQIDTPIALPTPPMGAAFGLLPVQAPDEAPNEGRDNAPVKSPCAGHLAALQTGTTATALSTPIVALAVPMLTSGAYWTVAVTQRPTQERLDEAPSWRLVGPFGGMPLDSVIAPSPMRVRIVADDTGLPALLRIVESLDGARRRSIEVILALDHPPPMSIVPAQVLFPARDVNPRFARSPATLKLLDDWGVAARIVTPSGWPGCFDGNLDEALSPPAMSKHDQTIPTIGDSVRQDLRPERPATVWLTARHQRGVTRYIATGGDRVDRQAGRVDGGPLKGFRIHPSGAVLRPWCA